MPAEAQAAANVSVEVICKKYIYFLVEDSRKHMFSSFSQGAEEKNN